MPHQELRYRLEGGDPCVDVRIKSLEHVFDNRDPAPFRERDLDPDLADYLIDAGDDLPAGDRARLVFWLEQPPQAGEIEQGVRGHFEHALDRLVRTRRRHREVGLLTLLFAVVFLGVIQFFGHFTALAFGGALGGGVREGLVILSWVFLWRPVEILIYDWIPVRHQRKVIGRLLAAKVEVRAGKGPPA